MTNVSDGIYTLSAWLKLVTNILSRSKGVLDFDIDKRQHHHRYHPFTIFMSAKLLVVLIYARFEASLFFIHLASLPYICSDRPP